MKHLLQNVFIVAVVLLTAFGVEAQVLSPDDPVREYDASSPPQQPPFGQVGDWVRTKRVNWNSDDYKAYIYKGLRVRLKFPKNYNPNASKTYPVAVMFHGRGEASESLYDNEKQLLIAARDFQAAIDNGKYDGYALFPQSYGGFSDNEKQALKEFIDYMVQNAHVDPYRVSIHGLSNGGKAVWSYLIANTKEVASAIPMSATTSDRSNEILNKIKYTPIWNSQGGLDRNPTPGYSRTLFTTMINDFGANMRYTLYPELGHGVWNTHYREPDFFPFLMRANKVNPWPLFERKEFCPGDAISLTLGLTPGFEAYEWRKNGAVIAGATTNQLVVNAVGTYDARVKQGGVWSYWSPIPVEVKVKTATQTPPVAVAALHSKVIPSPDGRNYTVLELPEGFEAYAWRKVGSSTVLGTERTLQVSTPGEYVATVTEKFGCSSNPSAPFKVVSASGANAPNPATGASAITLSKTSIKVAWSDNPSAAYDETGFEIYRATQAGGPYNLTKINPANVLSYTDTDLKSGQSYYYVIRAINKNGAAVLSNETTTTTDSDTTPPTTPLNLALVANNTTSATLDWYESTDDVGIDRYIVYRNGVQSVVTDEPKATVYNLAPDQVYNFTVKAVDVSGNFSSASNQVTVQTVANGITYYYYEGAYSKLPNFNTLNALEVGQVNNFTTEPRNTENNYAFKFEGVINIPTSGQYTFYTASDDGSKLYIGGFEESKLVVSNDGVHGKTEKSGTLTLQAGSYPIFVTYFQGVGGKALEVRWSGPGISKQLIPDAAFKNNKGLPGNPPTAPSQLAATAAAYDKVDLTWKDNSNNENGFQVYRASSPTGTYQPIALTEANQTTYQDKDLQASTTYYYRILAVGEFGESAFSSQTGVSATTPATPSAPAAPTNLTATPASASRIELTWTDQSSNETGFEVYRAVGANSDYLPLATIAVASGSATKVTYSDQNLFTNTQYSYKVRALGTANNSPFSPVVSTQTITGGNYDPTISTIADVTVKTLGVANVSVSASDANGDKVTLSGTNFPAFATLTDNGNGTGTIKLAPQANDRGDYTLTVKATDDKGGVNTSAFVVTVNNVQTAFTLSVNFHTNSSTAAPAPWNNISSITAGSSIALVDQNNAPSNVSMTLVDGWGGTGDQGVTSGLYPGVVSKSYFYIWQESARRIKVSGLNSNYQYSFTFFASRAGRTDNRTATYTIGSKTVTLDPLDNSSNTVIIDNVVADQNGEVTIVIDKASGSRNAYINAMIIEGFIESNSAPKAPSNLVASLNGATTVALNWKDNALDETGFEVYRSANNGSSFDLVKTTAGNITSYNDTGLNSSIAYQYKVRAINGNGASAYTNVATATTTNLPATPTALTGTTVSDTQVKLTWVDNATNETGYKVYRATSKTGTYTAVGTLGANSTSFTNTGLQANRIYYYKVGAQNAQGESVLAGPVAVATQSFTVYINFSDPGEPAPSPWNNTGNEPAIGNTYNNLKNQNGTNTGIAMSVVQNSKGTTFAASGAKGAVTGDNSGVYPDAVIKSYWWIEQVEVATLKFDNLDLGLQYDFTFFGSRTATSRGTDFTVNGTTVILDAANNTTQTVAINNISPNADGQIIVDMTSMKGAILGYVGAIVVRASPNTGEQTNARGMVASTKPSSSVSASKDLLSTNINVYPNPFAEKFSVGFELDDDSPEEYQVTVYNLTGAEVYSQRLPYDYELEGVSVDLSGKNVPQGSYVLRITSEKGLNQSVRLLKY